MNFVDRYKAGLLPDPAAELERLIAAWHDDEVVTEAVSLHEWLGLSWDQYAAWTQDPSQLQKVLG
jgi:hypothetical protein